MSNFSASITQHSNFPVVSRVQAELLSRREAQLVDYLATHTGRYVSSEELGDAIYGPARGDSVIQVLVLRIRAKLGADFIESAQGFGYRLQASRADELAWRCSRCGRAVVLYSDVWTCYGCGAGGPRARDIDPLPDEHWECAYCGKVFQRPRDAVEYERSRRPGARTFCSLDCARRAPKRRGP